MTAPTIFLIVLTIIIVDYIFEQSLDWLNMKRLSLDIPKALADIYSKEKHEKSILYQKTISKFSFLTSGYSVVLYVIVLLTGTLGWINNFLSQYIQDPIMLSLSFFGTLYIISDVISTPFSYYKTFRIEEKFGFNKMKPKTFFIDKIKSYILIAAIGGLIFYILLWLIGNMGEYFWLYFWGVISVFMLLINMFYTSLIVPLFNKLTPLEDGELRLAIEEYSKRVGFPLTNIYVINGSKRSSKANAYFSGLGPNKKIVLYDTLINNHTTEELVAVLAHEVGHYKKKHVLSAFAASILQTGLMLYILSLFIQSQELSIALGGSETVIHLNLLAFGILYTPISKISGIIMNIISRKNEFEADQYAADTYEGKHLQSALKKLSSDHLSHLTPHPAYVFLHYSHPPLVKRLEAINSK